MAPRQAEGPGGSRAASGPRAPARAEGFRSGDGARAGGRAGRRGGSAERCPRGLRGAGLAGRGLVTGRCLHRWGRSFVRRAGLPGWAGVSWALFYWTRAVQRGPGLGTPRTLGGLFEPYPLLCPR